MVAYGSTVFMFDKLKFDNPKTFQLCVTILFDEYDICFNFHRVDNFWCTYFGQWTSPWTLLETNSWRQTRTHWWGCYFVVKISWRTDYRLLFVIKYLLRSMSRYLLGDISQFTFRSDHFTGFAFRLTTEK